MSKMIKLPEMKVISREEVQARKEKSEQEIAMKEKYAENEYPQEYERFESFLKALEADSVKLTVTDKDGQTEEHTFTAEQAQGEAWRLLAARDAGAMVKVEPEAREHKFVVVSGLTEASLAAMKADGHMPALTTETAAGRFQSVFKVRAGAEGEIQKIRETLQTRYGNGQQEGIVVPGFYGNSLDRIPRIVSCNEAAPVLGPERLAERLQEQEPAYAQAFREEQERMAGEKKRKEEEEPGQRKKEEPEQMQEQGPSLGIFTMLKKLIMFIVDVVKQGFDSAIKNFNLQKHCGFSVKETKEAPPYWRDKSQWPQAELEQKPEFSREQKAAAEQKAEAPAQKVAAIREIKAQAQQEVQSQEAKAARKRSRGR
ncbi:MULTISPECIES: DNA-primase RepB domain-containing protein [unclassified Desulfovibrio]|uniref:DNA-primase RepB domain-containing protein n=1 Tax=unclassified Desulfovibrio TaxID=2593640 RepID=UPI002FDB0F63